MKFLNRFGWVLLAAVAALVFAQSFLPGMVLFSNDIPNAMLHADYYSDPTSVLGTWVNLNWVGVPAAAVPLSGHTLLVFLLGPAGYSKFAGMLASIFLGWSGWFYFRRVGMDPLLSLLGGIGLMLNMVFLGFTAWGVFAWNLGIGFAMIAFAILHQERYTAKDLIAVGFCIGMCVNDGTDVGAILATVIGIYFVFRNFPRSPKAAVTSVLQLATIVVLALLIASNRVSSLLGTYVEGVQKEIPTEQSKQEQWNFITQWSLPKKEAAGMVIPGLFGYRMDTPGGGQYWGEVGRSPGWQPEFGPGGARSTGGGQYVGKAVLLMALFAALAAFIPKLKTTAALQSGRREIIFWVVTCLVTLTLTFGKFFFTFKILFALPIFSSFRNTGKYGVPFMIGLVILFVHGLRLLTAKSSPDQKKLLLKLFLGVSGFFVLFHVILLAFWSGARDKVLAYLFENAFDGPSSQAIYSFSQNEIILSFVVLLLTGALLLFCLRAKNTSAALIALAVLLAVDLGWADHHWVRYYNYQQRYVTNPILDALREKPYEHRVSGPRGGGVSLLMMIAHQQSQQSRDWVQGISSFYYGEWLQHNFQYFNIESPDIIQWPRMPILDGKFDRAFALKISPDGRTYDVPASLNGARRFWELTNTRYLLASTACLQFLQSFFTNSQFGLVKSYDLARNGEYYTAIPTTNGSLALIEFSNALPRAKFYSAWRNEPDEDKALALIAGDQFDPAREVVVVANEVSGIQPGSPGAAAEVKITDHGHKRYVISVTNAAPGVLLLNSRYDRNWRVSVDGQPQTLLRCNFLMSGVALPVAGKHEVIFRYAPDPTLFYVNAVSVAVLLGLLVVPFGKRQAGEVASSKGKTGAGAAQGREK